MAKLQGVERLAVAERHLLHLEAQLRGQPIQGARTQEVEAIQVEVAADRQRQVAALVQDALAGRRQLAQGFQFRRPPGGDQRQPGRRQVHGGEGARLRRALLLRFGQDQAEVAVRLQAAPFIAADVEHVAHPALAEGVAGAQRLAGFARPAGDHQQPAPAQARQVAGREPDLRSRARRRGQAGHLLEDQAGGEGQIIRRAAAGEEDVRIPAAGQEVPNLAGAPGDLFDGGGPHLGLRQQLAPCVITGRIGCWHGFCSRKRYCKIKLLRSVGFPQWLGLAGAVDIMTSWAARRGVSVSDGSMVMP